MLLYPLWIARGQGRPLRFPSARAIFTELGYALVAQVLIVVALSVVLTALGSLFGEAVLPTSPVGPPQGRPPLEAVGVVVLALIAAPIVEEVFYRGMLYNAFRSRMHPLGASALSAILFGLAHLRLGVATSAQVAFVGLCLALVYEWRKTLLTPMFMHSLQNGLGLAILTWSYFHTPILGVQGVPDQVGCRVTKVVPGSAADVAGVQVGDVIVTVDEESVSNVSTIAKIVRSRVVGDRLTVHFIRSGIDHRVKAVLRAPQ
jgi:membrane protease YdiL (CAAX protease family)